MIPNNFKPMLAINQDKVSTQPSTRYCSQKLDGVRVLFFGGVAYSRSLKPLPNKLLQKLAQDNAEILESCDGEVIAGPRITAEGVLQRTTSFCMSADSTDEFNVYLFDKYIPDTYWYKRFSELLDIEKYLPDRVKVLQHFFVPEKYSVPPVSASLVNLEEFEKDVLESGGEGVMVRDAFGFYKCGRSGKRTPELQKYKRFDDMEFEVVGYQQFESNQNEAEKNELGYTKRSTSKEGKVLVEQLGSLVCKLPDGRTFNVGSGFTLQQRKELWETKDELCGRLAKVQYFGFSPDGVPLLPVFLDFRSEMDI